MDGLTEGRIVHYVMPDGVEHRPAIVVKVWRNVDGMPPENGVCQLQVFTDGSNDLYHLQSPDGSEYGLDREAVKSGIMWRTSVLYSEEPLPNTWHWIEKA